MTTSRPTRDSAKDLVKLLDLAIPEGDRSRCRGWAPSKGRRCRNPVSCFNYEIIKDHKLKNLSLDDHELEEDLSDIAGMVLCYLHGGQKTELSRKWAPLVQRYRRHSRRNETGRANVNTRTPHAHARNSRESTTVRNSSTSFVQTPTDPHPAARAHRSDDEQNQQLSHLVDISQQMLVKFDKILKRLDDLEQMQQPPASSTDTSPRSNLREHTPDIAHSQPTSRSTTTAHLHESSSRMGSSSSRPATQECPICREDMEDVRRTPCGHEFCTPCITSWLENQPRLDPTDSTSKTSCPTCRRALSKRDLKNPAAVPPVKVSNPEDLIRGLEALVIEMKSRNQASTSLRDIIVGSV